MVGGFGGARDGGAIVAGWRGDPQRRPFILPDGQADRWREFTKAQLRCIFGDCPSPALTTVARSRGYHHFRHLNGEQHSSESVNHINAKAVLAEHLRTSSPDLEVVVEWALSSRRERIADVAVRVPSTGARFAIEVQYAALSIDEWQARTGDYIAQGVQPVWLFGHVGAQFRRVQVRGAQGSFVRLNRLQRFIAGQGGLVRWIDPNAKRLGIARSWSAPPAQVPIDGEPLSELAVSADGPDTPGWTAARAELAKVLPWRAVRANLTAEQLRSLKAERETAERAKKEAQVEWEREAFARLNQRLGRGGPNPKVSSPLAAPDD